MEFFNASVDVLGTLVVALGSGLGIWGGINLLEGYGNDSAGAKSQGIKHLIPKLLELKNTSISEFNLINNSIKKVYRLRMSVDFYIFLPVSR